MIIIIILIYRLKKKNEKWTGHENKKYFVNGTKFPMFHSYKESGVLQQTPRGTVGHGAAKKMAYITMLLYLCVYCFWSCRHYAIVYAM